MLVRSIAASLPGLQPCYFAFDALHPRFRVRSLQHRGVINDDRLLYGKVRWAGRADDRAVLSVVLSGEQRVSMAGERDRWLGPGEFALCNQFALLDRRDQGECAHSLSFEWHEGVLGRAPAEGMAQGRLTERELRALQSTAVAFAASGYDPARAAIHLAEMVSLLAAAGLPLHGDVTTDALLDPEAERFALLSRAIDASLSTSGAYPMTVDLESAIGRSRWQTWRRVAAMNGHFGLNGNNWRETREPWRMMFTLMLLTHADATPAAVAKSLGYGAPAALYHALANVGLPAPGRVKDAAKALL